MSTYVESCTWTHPRKSKWCRDQELARHHVLQLIQFCRDTSRWINECEIVFETVHTVIVSCVKIYIKTRLLQRTCLTVCSHRAKQWEISTQTHTPPHMSKGVREHVLISQKNSQRYRKQNNKGLQHAASSDGAGVVVVMKTDCGQSFFVVSILDHRGQSSWSVFIRGQSFFLVFVFSRRL